MEILRQKKKLWFSFLVLLAVAPALIFLISRSRQVESWDNWNWGSAQTMLTVRYWVRDGFFQHRLFFLLKGYHPEVEILDRPEFRFATGDTLTGGLVGNRLYYNHYPTNYVIPYGLLGKLGAVDRFWFRLLSIIFSVSAAAFMAGFVYLLANRNRWMALLAIFYYTTTTSFLSYADSLNNTPLDDFFKWLVLFLSVYYWKKTESQAPPPRLKKIIWVLYFILASVSLDSTFFVFFWLCALSFIETRKLNFKEYAGWALAPITAFAIQFTQNSFYLSAKGAALDFWGDFLYRSKEASAILSGLPPIIKNIVAALSTAGYFSDLRTKLAIPLILLLAYFLFKEKTSGRLPQYAVALAISGGIYPFLFPIAGTFGYQGRQMAPALLLLLAFGTWQVYKKLIEKQFSYNLLAVVLLLAALWAGHFLKSFRYIQAWPNNVFPKEEMVFLQNLHEVSDSSTMILRIKSDATKTDRANDEFYADRLMLYFKDVPTLVEYMDKIYATIPGRVNFLLLLSTNDYPEAWRRLTAMKDYSFNDMAVDHPADNIKVIRVRHK